MYYYGTLGYGFGILGFIFDVLWWILVVSLIVTIVRALRRDGRWRVGEKTALDILEERYARGEIDKTEFEEKKKDLTR